MSRIEFFTATPDGKKHYILGATPYPDPNRLCVATHCGMVFINVAWASWLGMNIDTFVNLIGEHKHDDNWRWVTPGYLANVGAQLEREYPHDSIAHALALLELAAKFLAHVESTYSPLTKESEYTELARRGLDVLGNDPNDYEDAASYAEDILDAIRYELRNRTQDAKAEIKAAALALAKTQVFGRKF